MQNHSSVERLFYTNLLLLGFDPQQYEREYQTRLHQEMFQTSNLKAMEVVVWFLLGKYEGEKARNIRLKGVWPVHAGPERTNFRRIAATWMQQVLKRNVNQSLLQTCYGENFYQLMHDLTYHVLHQQLLTEHSEYANEHLPLGLLSGQHLDTFANNPDTQEASAKLSFLSNSLALHIRNQNDLLLRNATDFAHVQEQWRIYADKINNEIQQVQQSDGVAQEKLKQNTYSHIQQDQIKSSWDSLQQHHSEFTGLRKYQKEICDNSLSEATTKTRDVKEVLKHQENQIDTLYKSFSGLNRAESLLGNTFDIQQCIAEQNQTNWSYVHQLSHELNDLIHQMEQSVQERQKQVQSSQSEDRYHLSMPSPTSKTLTANYGLTATTVSLDHIPE